jgi:hypothetical protein
MLAYEILLTVLVFSGIALYVQIFYPQTELVAMAL